MTADGGDLRGGLDRLAVGREAIEGLPVGVRTALAGAVAGLAGALALSLVDPDPEPLWLAVGPLYGAALPVLVGRRTTDPGRGLVWGLGTGLLAWAAVVWLVAGLGVSVGPFTTTGDSFTWSVYLILGLGAPVGLVLGWLGGRRVASERTPLDLPRALLVGGAAGLVGGWAFGVWMGQEDVFPLIAGLVGSDSALVGRLLHYLIAATIGVGFGLLFQRDARGFGSSIAWGMAYGILWWFLGGLTLLALLLGDPVTWTTAAASEQVGSLVGHVVYGLLLGLLYSVLDRFWRVLFVESDPLNYEATGPGIRTLRAMGWGLVASLVGGLAFGAVMWSTGELEMVAALVGRSSALAGFGVHLAVSSIVGMSYGRLFRYEAPTLAAGVAWGAVYGLVWWFVGPLTLMPVLLGEPLAWSADGLATALPSLFGHLAYGAPTGAAFYLLERRHRAWERLDPHVADRERRRRREVGTPAPAVWTVTLGTAFLVVAVLL